MSRPGLDRLPEDMRGRPQWCVAFDDGMPRNPRTFDVAYVNDAATWGTFAEACASAAPFVGYVLSVDDPYTIIDFDDKPHKPIDEQTRALHYRLLDALNTYTERSRSGRGYHAVCVGSVPYAVRRNSLEIDSASRFMICTGDVVNPVPPRHVQDVLNSVYAELEAVAPPTVRQLVELSPTMLDAHVMQIASGATNGAKFDALYAGAWRELGYKPNDSNTGSSEADYALLDMLCFYTRSNEQVRRLFLASELGKREKAQRKLEHNLARIRAEELPEIDSSELIANLARARSVPTLEPVAPQAPAVPMPPASVASIPLPPSSRFPHGLVGELADYIFTSSIRPVPEIALVTSIGLLAGIAGRSYNISGTGLNQYLIVLANTGRGKDETKKGINRILGYVSQTAPMVHEFRGPANFASGQGLIRTLDKRPCFVSVLGECGAWMHDLCDPNAPSGSRVLKRMLLDIYSQSGRDSILQPTAYSDAEKNTKSVASPAVTLLGESSPDKFYNGLDVESISDGLLPRFTIVEYTGKRPGKNPNSGHVPNASLVSRIVDLVTTAVTTGASGQAIEVKATPEAQAMLDDFDKQCDDLINDALGSAEAELWNRAHLKALKLAGLLAVGCNHRAPVIDTVSAVWAIRFVEAEARSLLRRFETGNVGKGEAKQEHILRDIVQAFIDAKPRDVRSYRITNEMHRDGIIPLRFIQLRALKLAAFQTDRRGATRALREMLDSMQRAGQLVRLSPQALINYGLRSEAYAVGEFF